MPIEGSIQFGEFMRSKFDLQDSEQADQLGIGEI